MAEPSITPPTPAPEPAEPRPYRDSLVAAMWIQLVSPFRPRRTFRRCRNINLFDAWLSHVLTAWAAVIGLFLVALFLNFLHQWVSWMQKPPSYREMRVQPSFGSMLSEAINALAYTMLQTEAQVVLVVTVILIELAFPTTACVLSPWAADHDRPGNILKRAIKTCWLQTSTVAWGILGAIVIVEGIEIARDIPSVRNIVGQRFLPRYEEFTAAWLTILMFSVLLAVLLRALATSCRKDTNDNEDPICETCGYNLSHTDPASRCPECGEPVVNSFAPGLRCPPVWEQSGSRWRLNTYIRCVAAALLTPSRFFRTMPTRTGQSRARTALVLNLTLASVIFTSLMLELYVLTKNRPLRNDDLLAFTFIPPAAFGLLTGLVCVTALTTGLYCSITLKRPLLGPIAKVFFYGSSFVAVWLVLAAVMIDLLHWISIHRPHGLVPWLDRKGMGPGEQGILLGLCLNLFGLYFWFDYHRRAVQKVLYANT